MKASLFELEVEIADEYVADGSFRRKSDVEAEAYNSRLLYFFYRKLLNVPMPHYIDVGANTGAFTLLSTHVPLSKVYAIEPNPIIYPVLKKNCDLNAIPAILIPSAAWDRSATLTLHGCSIHGLSRVEHPFSQGTVGIHEVQGRTLDSIASTYGIGKCNFIKIDVEGAELHVLRGAEGLIEAHHPAIFLEWWPPHCKVFGYHPEEIDQWLAERGYDKHSVGHYAYYELRKT